MDAQQFAYWLQGFAELNEGPPSEAQWKSIRDHLALVFNKVTPPFPGIVKRGELHEIATWPHIDTTVTCRSGGSAAQTTC